VNGGGSSVKVGNSGNVSYTTGGSGVNGGGSGVNVGGCGESGGGDGTGGDMGRCRGQKVTVTVVL